MNAISVPTRYLHIFQAVPSLEVLKCVQCLSRSFIIRLISGHFSNNCYTLVKSQEVCYKKIKGGAKMEEDITKRPMLALESLGSVVITACRR